MSQYVQSVKTSFVSDLSQNQTFFIHPTLEQKISVICFAGSLVT